MKKCKQANWKVAGLSLVATLLLSACASTSTIYVVRHAEKSAPSGDSVLSAAGFQRAEALKDSMVSKRITNVYSTNYKRTRQTAGPTANWFGKTIGMYNNGDSLLQVLVTRKNGRTLIAGHSNTVPKMLRAVGLQPSFAGDIPDAQFDNLFVVTIRWRGKKKDITLQQKKYGELSE